jgi:hypothetical protein
MMFPRVTAFKIEIQKLKKICKGLKLWIAVTEDEKQRFSQLSHAAQHTIYFSVASNHGSVVPN